PRSAIAANAAGARNSRCLGRAQEGLRRRSGCGHRAQEPSLIRAAMTRPLNDGSTIACRFATHIQALAAVTGHQLITLSDNLEAPLLVRAAMTLPLDDLGTIVC